MIRILHIEDSIEWIEMVKQTISKIDNISYLPAISLNEATKIINYYYDEGEVINLLILDISLLACDPKNKGGFTFLDSLIKSSLDISTIVLSAYINVDNLRLAMRKYNVLDVINKMEFGMNSEILNKSIMDFISKYN